MNCLPARLVTAGQGERILEATRKKFPRETREGEYNPIMPRFVLWRRDRELVAAAKYYFPEI